MTNKENCIPPLNRNPNKRNMASLLKNVFPPHFSPHPNKPLVVHWLLIILQTATWSMKRSLKELYRTEPNIPRKPTPLKQLKKKWKKIDFLKFRTTYNDKYEVFHYLGPDPELPPNKTTDNRASTFGGKKKKNREKLHKQRTGRGIYKNVWILSSPRWTNRQSIFLKRHVAVSLPSEPIHRSRVCFV